MKNKGSGRWYLGVLALCLMGLSPLGFGAEAPAPTGAAAGPAADSPAAQALKEDAKCTRCHDESETKPVLAIYQTPHGNHADGRTPTCQACHGKSEQHLAGNKDGTGRPRPDHVFGTRAGTYKPDDAHAQGEQCLSCHTSGLRQHWPGSQHEARDVPCAACHSVHVAKDPVLVKSTQPEVCFTCHKEQRAQTLRLSTHPLAAGKMACTDCHNPHGSIAPKLLVKENVNETCYTCHAEKRGPFLWEHGPVTDDCTNCHTPHGSNSTPLLKARVPFLCQDCHTGDHASGINSGANLPDGAVTTVNGMQALAAQNPRAQTNARACLNCHVLIHGSNHPAGGKFQR